MDTVREYAVLVPLVEHGGELCLLYEVRARTLRRQPGEVCFPGGRMEGRETPEECALRETGEELGIPPEAVRILGRLDTIAHRAGFLMHPVLGSVTSAAAEAIVRSPAEVDEYFFIPLSWLMDHPPADYPCRIVSEMPADFPYEQAGIPRSYQRQPGRDSIPVYLWKDHAVWGLTGRITRHLVSLIQDFQEA